MARPAHIREEELLAAAREVFLQQGIRATTADIAKHAGVSEGTLFKRFRSKEELFLAAMRDPDDEEGMPDPIDLAARVGKASVEETLLELGRHLTDKFFILIPKMMMVWANSNGANGPFMPGKQPRIGGGPPPNAIRGIRMFAGYLEAEMRLGRISRHDPEIVARTFSGALWQYVFFEVTMGNVDPLPLPRDTFVRGLVHLLLQGLTPLGNTKPLESKSRPNPHTAHTAHTAHAAHAAHTAHTLPAAARRRSPPEVPVSSPYPKRSR